VGVKLTYDQKVVQRLSNKSDAELMARWNKIAGIIYQELTSLNLERQYMEAATDVVNGNKRFLHHPGRQFMDYVRGWYGNSMAAAYRRQTDTNPDSASLRVLLDEIKARPLAYGYDTLSPFISGYTQERIEVFVMRQVLSKSSPGIDVAIVEADLVKLESAGKTVKIFVNKHLAHTDVKQRTMPVQPSFNEVHAAAKACEEIGERWISALTTDSNVEVTDLVDWQDIFDFAWRNKNSDVT
jgi:hypothetical protein